jgi:hypothetical protein
MARLATRDQRGHSSGSEAPPAPLGPTHLTICTHPRCQKAFALKTALRNEAQALEIDLTLSDAPTLCRGDCPKGPYVGLPGLGLFYGNIPLRQAAELINETCLYGRLLFQRLLISPRKVTDNRVLYMRQQGVLVLLEKDRCPLAAAAYLFRFNAAESCGKCTPCRLGVPAVERIIRRLETGGADEQDLKQLRSLLHTMARDAYCEFAEKATAPLRLVLEISPQHLERHLSTGCPNAGAGLAQLGQGGA